MNYTKSKLETFSYSELKNIAQSNKIKLKRSKNALILNILENIKENNNLGPYEKKIQLGNKGKDGITYLITYKGEECAMKTFRKNKSTSKLETEVELQNLASEFKVCPKIKEFNTDLKYIIMEKMDKHLIDLIEKNKCLNLKQQKQIISIYKKLDKAKVFHADANLLNYMYKKSKLYIIDFGMSKKITKRLIKKLGTRQPNLHIMTLGLVLSLKDMNLSSDSYSYLVEQLKPEQRIQFNL